MMPMIAKPQPPPVITMPRLADANATRIAVSQTCEVQDRCLRCLLKTGKSPKTSILNSVRLNTCVVLGRRDASTVLAINAAFVEREAGNLASGPAP